MARTVGKAMYVVQDIWEAYALKLLKENPQWWGTNKNKIKNFTLWEDRDGKHVEVLDYPKFRKTIEYYFDRAKKAIIAGQCINMHGYIGKICVKRVERDFRKPKQRRVDWKKTRLQPKVIDPATGKEVYKNMIYYVTDDWCRIAWIKLRKVKNELIYEFAPANRNSAGTSGFKLEFSEAQKSDPLLKYQYLFNPLNLKKETA